MILVLMHVLINRIERLPWGTIYNNPQKIPGLAHHVASANLVVFAILWVILLCKLSLHFVCVDFHKIDRGQLPLGRIASELHTRLSPLFFGRLKTVVHTVPNSIRL